MKLRILTATASILLSSPAGVLSSEVSVRLCPRKFAFFCVNITRDLVPFLKPFVSIYQERKLRGSSSADPAYIAHGKSKKHHIYHRQYECWNYESTKDRQRMTNSWCFRAHEKCCSSQEKYESFDDFCVFYGFYPDPIGSSEGTPVATELLEDPINCTAAPKANRIV
jgi:hypothetical protein